MVNEDTDEQPSCPICYSADFGQCGHLIADIDTTFSEVNSGLISAALEDFQRIVNERLRAEINENRPKIFVDSELQSHWNDCVTVSREEDEPEVLPSFLLSWLILRLTEAGAVEPDGIIIDDGPPGFSSAVRLLFSNEPDQLVHRVYANAKLEMC
jgi:hypothetical protein